ncbi:MAG: 50S ribosomal protein L15 [Planctomycetota bacterium]|nr:MAG: 50S ribosomal protein L15 [Planctomycetota bacterium]
MRLHEAVRDTVGRKKKMRVGRGEGSGKGKTCGRGHKGAKSRSGYSRKLRYEGGQTPLQRRVPKVGFKNFARKTYAVINVGDLNRFDDGAEVTPEMLKERKIVKRLNDGLKILGEGSLERRLTVRAHKFSKSAIEKIAAAGGEAKVL